MNFKIFICTYKSWELVMAITILHKNMLVNVYIQLGLIRPLCFPFFLSPFSGPFSMFSLLFLPFLKKFYFLILSSCNKVFKVHTITTLKSKCLGQGPVWETLTTMALDNLKTYDLFQSNKDALRWRPTLHWRPTPRRS
jgi:hypothetical protein